MTYKGPATRALPNGQPVEKVQRHSGDHLDVHSIFYTIQGEGPFCGTPAVFIRLAGCNLQCPLCFGWSLKSREPYLTMADGPKKKMGDARVGDDLLTFDENGQLTETKIVNIIRREVAKWLEIVIDGRTYEVTHEHPFFTNRGMVEAQHLIVGDEILHSAPEDVIRWKKMGARNPMRNPIVANVHNGKPVQEIKEITGALEVHNISCAPHNTYLADGMWVHNCDTEYLSGRRLMAVEDIAAEVRKLAPAPALVVITGGEPFRQPLHKILIGLVAARYYVQIETNGTLDPPRLPPSIYSLDPFKRSGVYVVCSPKTGVIRPLVHELACCYKYVAQAGAMDEDGLPITALGHTANPRLGRPPEGTRKPIYLQPADEQEEPLNEQNLRAVVSAAMERGYIVQLQLHKILNME